MRRERPRWLEHVILRRRWPSWTGEIMGPGIPARPAWHPHNYEIFSGQLIAPGLPAIAEQQPMRELVNSYGKTWHTGHHESGGGHEIPRGEPMLMWSLTRDGEGDTALESDRAAAFGGTAPGGTEHGGTEHGGTKHGGRS